jgi:Uma2 family endonuclease
MITTLIHPITLEEFEALPKDQAARLEVVRGELVERMSPGIEHGYIAGEIIFLLKLWAKQGMGGYVGAEANYVLEVDPLTLRTPDVSYWSESKRPAGRLPKTSGHFPPDLAVEIISPSERSKAVQEKVSDYLRAGVALVWTVWPDAREVVAHTPNGDARTYRIGDLLEFPNVLPGFSCRVDDLFAQDTEAE